MIDTVLTRFGLARMPFGRDLPPSRLHRHHDCGEAAARIAWAVSEKTIAMITGEVGTGKTVAIRSAVADLDAAAHTVIYIGNPATGVRGILAHVVTALGGKPVHGTAALAAGRLGCDDGTDPAGAVSGAWLFISDARNTAAALARDLGCAQQQLAAVNGRPSAEQAEEGEP